MKGLYISLASFLNNEKVHIKNVAIHLLFVLLVFSQYSCDKKARKAYKDAVPRDSNGVIDGIVKGKIGYDIPETMNVGKNYNAIVTVSKSQNDSILFKNLEEVNFKREQISISSRVKIVLLDPINGKNFTITPLNTEEQLVDAKTNTVWRWNIEPKKVGENHLILRTTVKIKDRLGENYRDVEVFEKSITVEITIAKRISLFFGAYWQFLLSVIILPFGIWVYKKLKAQK